MDSDKPIKPEDVIGHAALMEGVLDSALVRLLHMKRAEPDEMFGLVAAYNTGQRLELLRSLLSREKGRDHEADDAGVRAAREVFKARNDFAHWMVGRWDESEQKFTGVKRHRGKPSNIEYTFEEVANLCGQSMRVSIWLGSIVHAYPSPYPD